MARISRADMAARFDALASDALAIAQDAPQPQQDPLLALAARAETYACMVREQEKPHVDPHVSWPQVYKDLCEAKVTIVQGVS